jgi:phage protein D/phage baseplate assembly protein gpV
MSNAITVTLYGKKTSDISDKLISLYVEHELNSIPKAVMVVSDGNFADRTYPMFNEADFQIGAELDIRIRYEEEGNSDTSIFQGVVVSSEFGVDKGLPILTLTLKDPAFRLVRAVNTTMFSKKNDKYMIEKVVSEATGVTLAKASSKLTSITYDQFIRKQSSAWDFVLQRASSFGLVTQLDNGKLNILDQDTTTGAKTIELGIDEVIDMQLNLDGENLNQEVEINYWDVKSNKTATVKQTSSAKLAKDISAPKANLTLLNLTDKKEAEGVGTYFSTFETQNELKGTVTVPGTSSVELMQKLTLKSFPTAYNGNYPISKLVHRLRFGTWTTEIGIGQNSLFTGKENSNENPTLPTVKNIEIATVLKWEKDPEGLGRIPVKVLAFGKDKYWVYPSQVGAGQKQSSYLLPEENEQVMIGFLHDNYNQGFIITSTYLGNNKPPAPFKLDAKTPVGFLSTAKMKLIFDDQKTEIEMSSSSANKMVLDKSKGVTINTNKNLKTSSSSKTDFKASGKMTLKGATIDLN